MEKICRKCKFHVVYNFPSENPGPRCHHPNVVKLHLVTGEMYSESRCDTLRYSLGQNECGKDGLWFEEKARVTFRDNFIGFFK